MKKIFSLVLGVIILLSSISVFADDVDKFWDAYSKSSYSGEMTYTIGAKFNKPLSDELKPMYGLIDGMSIATNAKYNIDKSGKKLEMQFDMALNCPVDSKLNTKMSYWYKIDASDINVPKVLVIMKQDGNPKYMYMNQDKPTVYGASNVSSMPDSTKVQEVNDKITELYKKYIKPEYKNGVYEAKIDEASLKTIIRQTALLVYDFVVPQYNVDSSTDLKAEYEKQVNDFFDKIDKIKIFSDNAFVIKMTVDDKNQPKTLGYDINFNTNLFDLLTAFDVPAETAGFTKNNSDLDMTLSMNYNFTKFNEPVTIEYPALTAENSIDMMGMAAQPELDVNAVNVVQNGKIINLTNKPFIKDGITYVPLRETLNNVGVDNSDIVWKDENQEIDINIKASYYNSYSTTFDLVGSNKNVGKTFIIHIEEKDMYIGETKMSLDSPVLLVGDATYVPAKALEYLGVGIKTKNFYNKDNSVIGSVVALYDVWDEKGLTTTTEKQMADTNTMKNKVLDKFSYVINLISK